MLLRASACTTFPVVAAVAAALSGCGDGDTYLMPMACAVPVAGSPARGPEDALVTIIEFADFECAYCGRVQPTLDGLEEEYEGQLRWVFKHLPLVGMHPHAFDAAIATECAGDQGRFWDMARDVFERQASLSSAVFAVIAESLQLDMDAWRACYDSQAPEARIYADVELGLEYGVGATPTFIINGIPVVGAAPLSVFSAVVNRALADARESGLGGAEYYASLVEQGCR